MRNVVTIREFTRNIYSHVKTSGVYILTVNGKEEIVVTIQKIPKGKSIVVVTSPTPEVTTLRTIVTTSGIMQGKHACGCKKGETKLCKTHHRS